MESFAESFAERGCLTVSKLFDPAIIAAVHDEYLRQFSEISMDTLPPHLKVGDRRVHVPIELKGPLLDPMLTANPLLIRMIEAILGPDPVIDSVICVVAFAGAKDQHVHRDHYELFARDDRGGEHLPAFAVTVSIPLIDLTAETGSTLLFPSSHRLEPAADGLPPPLGAGELASVERGGCYFMDYRLWHYGTANRSAAPRPILYIIYARPWFTDMLNFKNHARLRLAQENLMHLPRAERRLFRRVAAQGALDLTEQELLTDS